MGKYEKDSEKNQQNTAPATQVPVYRVYQTVQPKQAIYDDDFESDTKVLPRFLLNPNPQPMILPPMNKEESPRVWSQVSQQINSMPNAVFKFSKKATASEPEFMIEIQTSNPPGQRGVNISVKQLGVDAEPLPTLQEWQAYFNGQANNGLTKKLQEISGGSQVVTAIINEDGDLEFFAQSDTGLVRNLTEQEIAVLAIDVAALMEVGIQNACVYQHKFGEGADIPALVSQAQNAQPVVDVAKKTSALNNANILVEDESKDSILIKNENGNIEYHVKFLDDNGVNSSRKLEADKPEDAEILRKVEILVSQTMSLDEAGFAKFRTRIDNKTIDEALEAMPKNESGLTTVPLARTNTAVLQTELKSAVAESHGAPKNKLHRPNH